MSSETQIANIINDILVSAVCVKTIIIYIMYIIIRNIMYFSRFIIFLL